MTLVAGTRIGHYEILAPIGAGGMGEVYRARDTRLDRDVAIKILPELFAADPERIARFEREARVLASLNHPNIAAIYGLEPAAGAGVKSLALVLELVDGTALDAVIGRGGLPIPDVLRFAIQMADALAAAHAAGVIHRDLKPANIIVTRAGAVKVLDFGLAKISAVDTFAATMTAHAPAQHTAEGAVMGTVAYMSPEQAAGRPVDARSDIFSFGSVLFEMVTGARAFEGDTSMSTLAAIIHQPARPVSQINAAVPRELERVISRCHRKDPARRVQSMGDLRVALEELRDDLESGRLSAAVPAAITPPGFAWRRPAAFAAAGLMALAAGAFAGYTLKPSASAAAPALSIRHVTADVGVTDDPAVTPNGSLIAYASDRFDGTNRDIWVQQASGGDPVRVTTHAADDGEPAFSPDGSRIAFRSERDGGGIYIVPALGGSERLLVRDGRSPAFSPDGKWLVYLTGGRGTVVSLFVMPAAGGEPRRLFAGGDVAGKAIWAPDSARVMVPGRHAGETDAFIVAIDEKASSAGRAAGLRAVLPAGESPVLEAWTGDRVLYSSERESGGIWSVELRDGSAVRVVPVYQSASRIGRVAVDAAGQMYFASVSRRTALWSIPEGPRAAGAAPMAITITAAADDMPSLSADGRSLAFQSTRRTDANVWVRDMSTGRETAVPSPADTIDAVLSPDGRTVAYTRPVAGADETELATVGASGGVPRAVCRKCAIQIWAWTADGRALLVGTPRPNVLSVIDVATGKAERVIEGHDNQIWLARNSPDGRWLSFIRWPAADRSRIYIAPFTRGAPMPEASWIPVTSGETVDEEQAWAPDGRTIYFVSERDGFRCIYAAPFDPAAGRVGAIQPIMHAHGTRRRIVPTASNPGRLDAGGGRLVFPMQEIQSNIYALTVEKAAR